MSDEQSISSFIKQHQKRMEELRKQERLLDADVDARWRAIWERGKTSFAALRLDEALFGSDAAYLVDGILNFTLFKWGIIKCRDGEGAEVDVAIIEAHAGDQVKLEHFVHQMCTAFKGLKAAFMDGGRAVALSEDWDGFVDLGRADPADYEALALKLLGEGSEVICLDEFKLSRFENNADPMHVYFHYNALEARGGGNYVEIARNVKAALKGLQ